MSHLFFGLAKDKQGHFRKGIFLYFKPFFFRKQSKEPFYVVAIFLLEKPLGHISTKKIYNFMLSKNVNISY
jgi:hypothetical protein